MQTQRRTVLKLGLLLLVAVAALSITSLATAQSSPSYQLGCWGIITAGGGVRASTFYRLSDSTGQVAVGQSASDSYTIRSGYIQPALVVPGSRAAAITAPDGPAQNAEIYIPILNRSVRIVYVCPY